MGKKTNKAPKGEAAPKKQEVVQQEAAEKEAPKYVNPVLGWGIILGEIVVAAAIAAAIILPLM